MKWPALTQADAGRLSGFARRTAVPGAFFLLAACSDLPAPTGGSLEEASALSAAGASQETPALSLQTFSGVGTAGTESLRERLLEMEASNPGGTSRTVVSTLVDGERRVISGGHWTEVLSDDLRIHPELLRSGDPSGSP